jgi:hypothetical protein
MIKACVGCWDTGWEGYMMSEPLPMAKKVSNASMSSYRI